MPTRNRNLHQNERRDSRAGNTMIEFALVFGLFLAFTAGTFEMGRAIWTWASVAHSATEGARFASMHSVENPAEAPPGATITTTSTDAAIEAVVKKNAVGLNQNNLNVEVIWSAGGVPGSDVTVRASYPFSMIMGPLLGNIAENMTISRSSTSPVVN